MYIYSFLKFLDAIGKKKKVVIKSIYIYISAYLSKKGEWENLTSEANDAI